MTFNLTPELFGVRFAEKRNKPIDEGTSEICRETEQTQTVHCTHTNPREGYFGDGRSFIKKKTKKKKKNSTTPNSTNTNGLSNTTLIIFHRQVSSLFLAIDAS
jgi:hypothetical protein